MSEPCAAFQRSKEAFSGKCDWGARHGHVTLAVMKDHMFFPARPLRFFVFILLCLLPLSALAETQRIKSPDALRNALEGGAGGSFLLADGDYGTLEVTWPFKQAVELKAERLHGATFEVIRLNGTTDVTLDGLRLSGLAIQAGSERITVRNAKVSGNLYVRSVKDLTLTDNEVTGGRWGVLLNSVQGFVVRHNKIHVAGEDLMRITGPSSNGLVEYNEIADTVAKRPIHPDIIQLFHVRGVTPTDITIRRNLLHDPGVKGNVTAQGIFINDPGRGEQNQGYQHILLEENLINTASVNTIYVNSGRSNVIIRNNTLMSRNSGGANIRLVGKEFGDGGPRIHDNVFRQLIKEKRAAPIRNNLTYGKTGEVRLFSGPGTRWQDYLPVLGSTYDKSGMGAVDFLADLQAGRARIGPSWLVD